MSVQSATYAGLLRALKQFDLAGVPLLGVKGVNMKLYGMDPVYNLR